MAEKIIYYEPQPTNSHGFRVEAHCRPDVKRGHNIRDPQYVENRINVDLNLPHTTICDMGSLPEAFEKIFVPIGVFNPYKPLASFACFFRCFISSFERMFASKL